MMSTNSCNGYSTKKVMASAEYLKSKMHINPKIGIICGSGLSGIGEIVTNKKVILYKEIPSFVESTVPGHKGQLVFGQLGGKDVICMQGRFHPYEGYEPWVVGFPVRVMKLLGVEILIVTNAAGGLNQSFSVGDFMLIKDHISMTTLGGFTPLKGPNDATFGPRFPPLNDAYDKKLSELFLETFKTLNIDNQLHRGVYCNVFGPAYETIAELNFLRMIGGDTVGMSTAQEVIAARHAGIRVVACSLVTNKCIMDYDTEQTVSHEEVLEVGKVRAKDMEKLVAKFIENINLS